MLALKDDVTREHHLLCHLSNLPHTLDTTRQLLAAHQEAPAILAIPLYALGGELRAGRRSSVAQQNDVEALVKCIQKGGQDTLIEVSAGEDESAYAVCSQGVSVVQASPEARQTVLVE